MPGSTLSLYTEALRLRRTHQLGRGDLAWNTGEGEDLVDFRNGGIRVITNFGHGARAAAAGGGAARQRRPRRRRQPAARHDRLDQGMTGVTTPDTLTT